MLRPIAKDSFGFTAAAQTESRSRRSRMRSSWMTETADDFDLEMPWPPKNFVSHKDADRLLKTDVHSRAILVP